MLPTRETPKKIPRKANDLMVKERRMPIIHGHDHFGMWFRRLGMIRLWITPSIRSALSPLLENCNERPGKSALEITTRLMPAAKLTAQHLKRRTVLKTELGIRPVGCMTVPCNP
jgi:hypothetical protein